MLNDKYITPPEHEMSQIPNEKILHTARTLVFIKDRVLVEEGEGVRARENGQTRASCEQRDKAMCLNRHPMMRCKVIYAFKVSETYVTRNRHQKWASASGAVKKAIVGRYMVLRMQDFI